jgi:TolB-like protein
MKKTLLAAFATVMLVTGCTQSPEPYPLVSQPLNGPTTLDMQGQAQKAADSMLYSIIGKFRMKKQAILPASFVDERNMDITTPFGRLLSRQFSNRFTQAGYSVLEIKLRKNILLEKGHGQLILTRELKKIRDAHDVYAVLAGSYVTSQNRIFISAQLIRLSDGVTIAANDFDMPLTRDVRSLLVK